MVACTTVSHQGNICIERMHKHMYHTQNPLVTVKKADIRAPYVFLGSRTKLCVHFSEYSQNITNPDWWNIV